MKYKIYKKRMMRNLYRQSRATKENLKVATLKLIPLSISFIVLIAFLYISLISVIIFNNSNKLSLQNKIETLQGEISELEIKVISEKQNLDKETVIALGFTEAENVRYLSAKKTASAISGNEI